MARIGRGFPATAIINRFRGESSAPTYSVNPALSAAAATTIDVVATAIDDLNGLLDHYMGLYAAGSTPTAAQVIAGAGTGFVASSNRSQLGIASGAQATFAQITGATNGHAYRVAATARDSYGNLATVYYLDFYTLIGQTSRAEVAATGYAGTLYHPTTITLVALSSRTGAARASLSNLHWAWFDQDDVATLLAPTDKGSAETTDSNGDLVITLTNTVLTSGQIGRLALETSDKAYLGQYRVQLP